MSSLFVSIDFGSRLEKGFVCFQIFLHVIISHSLTYLIGKNENCLIISPPLFLTQSRCLLFRGESKAALYGNVCEAPVHKLMLLRRNGYVSSNCYFPSLTNTRVSRTRLLGIIINFKINLHTLKI